MNQLINWRPNLWSKKKIVTVKPGPFCSLGSPAHDFPNQHLIHHIYYIRLVLILFNTVYYKQYIGCVYIIYKQFWFLHQLVLGKLSLPGTAEASSAKAQMVPGLGQGHEDTTIYIQDTEKVKLANILYIYIYSLHFIIGGCCSIFFWGCKKKHIRSWANSLKSQVFVQGPVDTRYDSFTLVKCYWAAPFLAKSQRM